MAAVISDLIKVLLYRKYKKLEVCYEIYKK